jgi:hypothetical protein
MKDEALKLALESLEHMLEDAKQERLTVEYWNECVDAITAIKQALAAPVKDLPFGVSGGLVAIKTLLGRDPCAHANTAIEMIDAILKEYPAAQRQWVSLTDHQLETIWYQTNSGGAMVIRFARAIEASLKEINT